MIDERNYTRLRSIIRSRTGIDIVCYSRSFITRRLEFRMNACNIKDYDDYLRLLEHSDEVKVFTAHLSINVTEFFRDPDVFARFADLLKDYDNARIWSVGCASGEEPYTIAIIAKENGIRCSILASDINRDAIERAKNGLYPFKSIRNVPKDILARYFMMTDGGYLVRRDVKDMVTFEIRDVTGSMPTGSFDFIFCRNMLIYMDAQSKETIIGNICNALKRHGYLILGKSEYVNYPAVLSCIDNKTKIYRKSV
ncbi:MAG: protein-glutamate O-methyltransferase CheR [Candidatus Nitrosocaldus sp.]|nr:protein-glutamate O-methyltransferase CheR [Candidatus Nitrosocaldus sp.]MDW8000918.1 protein-glutamate O-methyltransferase CheR [Candidatus Nitrosocaldus sp.]